ncbi:ECF transporter S component [Acetanaerobacterium elongatum]|uniref:ECF transporter S component n=1 Tax=Acetanaerobacterium elongatum TaxID=258515 RepID=A0A1H0F5E8_9FIRM|nr:ECF transporter S component [Acetanaerobacterium elongatum]SDN89826.1 Protein of unknown function [Acetanaerobacterium elongatum]
MKNQTKKLVYAAGCLAMGIILALLFHLLGGGLGNILLPMHIPVLLCGFLCGPLFGAACGVLLPLLSSIMIGIPPIFPVGAAMMFELCTYGLLSGLLYKKANVYISLIVAMLGGRIIGGAANAVLLGIAGKAYGLTAFVTTMFVTALPGIFIQLGLIPLLVIALTRARLINDPKGQNQKQ